MSTDCISCDYCGAWHVSGKGCLVLDYDDQQLILDSFDDLTCEYPIKDEGLLALLERMRDHQEQERIAQEALLRWAKSFAALPIEYEVLIE